MYAYLFYKAIGFIGLGFLILLIFITFYSMFKTLWQRFRTYYQERGRTELHSFFATFVPAFGVFLLFFGSEPLTALSAGVLSQDVFIAIGLAMARSFFAALLYMFFPLKFPLRTVKK